MVPKISTIAVLLLAVVVISSATLEEDFRQGLRTTIDGIKYTGDMLGVQVGGRLFDKLEAQAAPHVGPSPTNEHHYRLIDVEELLGGGDAGGRKLLARKAIVGGGEALAGDRFCDLQDDGSANCAGYGYWLINGVIFRAFLFFFFLLLIPCVLCFRCCGICGSARPTDGGCGGQTQMDNLYEKNQVIAFKAALCLVTFICFWCFIAGYIGANQVSKGIEEFKIAILDLADLILERGETAGDILSGLELTQDVNFDTVLQPVRDFKGQVESVDAQVAVYDGYRKIAINVALIVPFLLLLGGCMMGLLNVGLLPPCAACCITFFMFPLYLSAIVHGALNTVMDDLCYEVDLVLEGAENNAAGNNAALDVILRCSDDGSSPFQDLLDVALNALEEAKQQVCTAFLEICNLDTCGGTCASTPCDDLDDVLTTEICVGPSSQTFTITVEECAETPASSGTVTQDPCAQGTLRDASIAVYDAVNLVREYEDTIVNDILPLLNCSFIGEFLNSINDAVCGTMLTGVKNVSRASDAMIFFLILSFPILILGAKRFIPFSDPLIKDPDADSIIDRLRTGTALDSSTSTRSRAPSKAAEAKADKTLDYE